MNQDDTANTEESQLVEIAPPRPGGTKITSSRERFLTLDQPGQAIEGYILGQVTVKNQRGEDKPRYVMMLLNGHQVRLPDHVDLNQKLRSALDGYGIGARLWIGYLGREKVSGVSSPMARYEVWQYPTSDQERARVAEALANMAVA